MQTFRKGDPWPDEPSEYRKKATLAVKIKGSFVVETPEGPLRCENGYLAMDARGNYYPIATAEFRLIYERVLLPARTVQEKKR